MSDSARNPDDYCYRHPDRLSFVLCERCGRTICLECQHHQDGHVYCPDDALARVTQLKTARRTPARRVRSTPRFLSRISPETPVVTYAIGGLVVFLWLLDLILGGSRIEPSLVYVFGSQKTMPWTLVTSMFSMIGAGDAFINVLLFGFSMYVLGRLFERQLGHLKLLTLYVVSGLAASVFALLFNGVVESATAAFFGLVGAALVLFRRDRRNLLWIYIVIAVTVIQTLLSAARAIAWQGWVGGLVVGVAVAFAFEIDGSPQRVFRQRLIVAGIAAFLVVAAIVRTALS